MKIGIITHYYKTFNYGGALQSYALVKVLREMGYDAEQICLSRMQDRTLSEDCISVGDNTGKKKVSEKAKKKPAEGENEVKYDEIYRGYIAPRFIKFAEFLNEIPHSEKEYSANSIFMANDVYDAFITGSDQVWNFTWHNPGNFLEFADDDKKKIAYAVSAGTNKLDEVQKRYISRVLPRFDAVSVRETSLIDTYSRAADVKLSQALDSVLLLDSDKWDEIASERLVDDRYMFCFFYNPTYAMYELARDYADNHGLKIALIPYALCNRYMTIDDKLGDYRMGNASPADFISLIKYADCVFTDSLHTMYFSLIYQKQVYAFKRKVNLEMESRLLSLADMFDCRDHYCDDEANMTLEHIESIKPIDYSKEFKTFNKLKEESITFLKNALS